MIIYQSDARNFCNDVDNNSIGSEIEKNFMKQYGYMASDSEKRSWNNSMRFMETAIRKSEVPDDCGILIEYSLPPTSKRIDFIVTGHDQFDNPNLVIVELKQWEKAAATDKEDLVKSFVGGDIRELAHPSYQAYSYRKFLQDMNESITSYGITPFSCAYLHNYQRKTPEPLESNKYHKIIKESPLFLSEDAEKLQAFIRKYVGKGNGLKMLYTIDSGKIKPSRKFIECINEMFDGNEMFTLLDEQKVANSNIISYALNAKEKTTIIVNGGPGTGKSIVAMNAFIELLNNQKNLRFLAPNAAFKNAIIEGLSNSITYNKSRLKSLFTGSSSYYAVNKDEFDILIVDEAHRLKKKGAFQYKGENQVEDVIKGSFVNVFFIDDNQRIRPDDVGTVNEIYEAAFKYDSNVVNVALSTQFRCSGAEGFINWVTHNLHIEDTGNFKDWDTEAFEFMIFDDPHMVQDRIRSLREEGHNARMLAGFSWPWTDEKNGNPDAEINDVCIEEYDFEMPWNSRTNQYSWAVDNSKVNQVGCVHTSQGLEFDYVGVIIGNDLRYDKNTGSIYASYEDYYDRTGKKGLKDNPEELTAYIKNIYKVLMSRGMKGCYVFIRDENLRDFLKSRLPNSEKSKYTDYS